MTTQLLKCLAVVLCLGACNDEQGIDKPVQENDDESLRSKSVEAHNAFLSRDYQKMLSHVKVGLQIPQVPTYLKENLIGLTDKAITETKGDLPVDWTLPSEIKNLRVDVDRRDRGTEVYYKFAIKCQQSSGGIVDDLQVIQYPSNVLLDKKAGIGEVEEHFEPSDGTYYFELEGDRTPTPAESGLYLVKMTLTNGKRVDGWFILSNHVSDASPEVLSPARGQTVTTATPLFQWKDFFSSLYRPFEVRRLAFTVSKSEAPHYEWEPKIEHYEYDPTSTQISSEKPLENGRYVLLLMYREGYRFGPMTVNRMASTATHFYVKAN